jgi:small GTP-binding protein
MHPPAAAPSFSDPNSDLNQASQLRSRAALALQTMAGTLETAEQLGTNASGQLGLQREIQALSTASQQLQQGVFRLMVLGDMKRGKSTLINALLGEKVVPMDASPCTALLTILKYGAEKRVTVHFQDQRPPEVMDLNQFAATYTIPPDEAKRLEDRQETAFPAVSHAVVEYPLPLLESGIEIIDTPGLNDTQTRNQTTLECLYTCHAVLFVLSAAQPCTLDERRYLQNYLKERQVGLFFLINGWDLVAKSLPDPEDTHALTEAQTKILQVFQAQLAPYCPVASYDQRVFTISALEALRQRLKEPNADLADSSGFGAFVNQLTHFLRQERLEAELTWAEQVAKRSYAQVGEAIARRIPLLGDDTVELRAKIEAVQQEFNQLAAIRDQYQALIQATASRVADATAEDFKVYLGNLERTFEADFVASQPDLSLLEFLDEKNRGLFYANFKRAFERYLNDRLAAWEFMARQKLAQEFEQLGEQARTYSANYEQVVMAINQKLVGSRFEAAGNTYRRTDAAPWADGIREMFLGVPDIFNDVASRFSHFWQPVFQFALAYFFLYFGLYLLSMLLGGITTTFMVTILGGVGLVAGQAELVRQAFLEKTKTEFAKLVPELAERQAPMVAQAVKRCFNTYEAEISEQINIDIASRRAELANLLAQKESSQVDTDTEVQRLTGLETELAATLNQLCDLQH